MLKLTIIIKSQINAPGCFFAMSCNAMSPDMKLGFQFSIPPKTPKTKEENKPCNIWAHHILIVDLHLFRNRPTNLPVIPVLPFEGCI